MRALVIFLTATIWLLATFGCATAEPLSRHSIPPRYIGGKTAQDHIAAREVAALIRETMVAMHPERRDIKLHAAGGLRGYRITVYGVRADADQDRIVQLLKDNFPKNRWKPISILFFDRENFVPEGGGHLRKNEVLLFSAVVE